MGGCGGSELWEVGRGRRSCEADTWEPDGTALVVMLGSWEVGVVHVRLLLGPWEIGREAKQ